MTAPEDTTPETDAPDADLPEVAAEVAAPAADLPQAEAAGGTVDAGLRQRLDEIAALPLAAQAEAYQQIHAELQQSLADIDAG